MVIGPLFITRDMQPKAGSPFCTFMVPWISLSGVVHYAFARRPSGQFTLYGIVLDLVGELFDVIGFFGVDFRG